MKTRLYIAVLTILVALWGCTKVDVVEAPSRKISFEVGSYVPQTRANSVKEQENVTSFSSRAWMHGAGLSSVINFFPEESETILWDGQLWAPAIDYFWPKAAESYIDFAFWHGKSSPTVTYTESNGVRTATMTWAGYEVESSDNLMWADMAWHYKSSSTMDEYQMDGSYTGVPVLFHHALARIKLQAKATTLASSDGTSWTVTAHGYKFSDVYTIGTLQLTNTENSGTTAEHTEWTVASNWGNRAGKTDIYVNALDETLGTDTYTSLMDWYTVMPQSLSGVKLTLYYTIGTTYPDGTTISENASSTVSLVDFTGAPSAWEMNTLLTYNIAINPDTSVIEIVPEMTDWTSATADRKIE